MIKIGNATNVVDADLIKRCSELAKMYNPGNRTDNQVLHNTIRGEVTELLVCDYLGLTRETDVIDYDASKDGKKYEIKHTTIDTKYWNFHSYSHFQKVSGSLDYIIQAFYDVKTDQVNLKYIANAKSFNRYVRQSQFNNNYYYDNIRAINDGECKEF